MFIKLKRIIKFGFQSVFRNKGLSLQTIFIMVVAVGAFSSLVIFKDLSAFMINEIEKKVDISVYFKEGIEEARILSARDQLYEFSSEIKEIDYVSKDRAREIFIEAHQNDPLYLFALEEAGGNPFLASLNIKAGSPVFYARAADFLTSEPFKEIVEKVSYFENKTVIDKLYVLISNFKKAGLFFSVLLGLLVFLIVFNTIKLTIFALREEVSTMRLVGASNWFIQGPFIIQGFFYGLLSVLIVDLILFLCFIFFSQDLETWLLNFNLFDYFKDNFFFLLFWQIISALLLGGISSFLAVRKHLKA